MRDYVQKLKIEGSTDITIYFNIENQKLLKIGDNINAINEKAYMNGYNWEAFLNYYLRKTHPEVLTGMKTDSEAGTYVAYYMIGSENEKRADKLVSVIESLVEDENKLYDIIKNKGNKIKWDNLDSGLLYEIRVRLLLIRIWFNKMIKGQRGN